MLNFTKDVRQIEEQDMRHQNTEEEKGLKYCSSQPSIV